jgi:hypothetical protein
MGIHTPGQGWKNAVDKMETTLKNNYAFSNVVANLCEIITSPNRKLDFLTLEDGVNSLSQNFGKELPLYAV